MGSQQSQQPTSSKPPQVGRTKDWYVYDNYNGKILEQSTHLLDDGTYQTNNYWQDGTIKNIIHHTERDNIKNGQKSEFEEGVIKCTHTIVNDVRNGPYKLYSGGKLYETGSIKSNIKFGVRILYISKVNGVLYDKITETYDNGILHGLVRYYLNKKLVKIVNYSYGNVIETNDNPEEEKQPEKTLPSAPPAYRPKSEVDFPEVEKVPVKLEFPEVPKEEELVEGETPKKVVEA